MAKPLKWATCSHRQHAQLEALFRNLPFIDYNYRLKVKEAVTRLPVGQKRALKLVLGTVIGGILGYGYYVVVGCSSGGCAITSDPLFTTVWGSMVAVFIAAG